MRQLNGFGDIFIYAAFLVEQMVNQPRETLLKIADDIRRVIRGSAVDDHDLNIIRGLMNDTFEGFSDKSAEVVCRDADGKSDCTHVRIIFPYKDFRFPAKAS